MFDIFEDAFASYAWYTLENEVERQLTQQELKVFKNAINQDYEFDEGWHKGAQERAIKALGLVPYLKK